MNLLTNGPSHRADVSRWPRVPIQACNVCLVVRVSYYRKTFSLKLLMSRSATFCEVINDWRKQSRKICLRHSNVWWRAQTFTTDGLRRCQRFKLIILFPFGNLRSLQFRVNFPQEYERVFYSLYHLSTSWATKDPLFGFWWHLAWDCMSAKVNPASWMIC